MTWAIFMERLSFYLHFFPKKITLPRTRYLGSISGSIRLLLDRVLSNFASPGPKTKLRRLQHLHMCFKDLVTSSKKLKNPSIPRIRRFRHLPYFDGFWGETFAVMHVEPQKLDVLLEFIKLHNLARGLNL